jgi:hypothetical protein
MIACFTWTSASGTRLDAKTGNLDVGLANQLQIRRAADGAIDDNSSGNRCIRLPRYVARWRNLQAARPESTATGATCQAAPVS